MVIKGFDKNQRELTSVSSYVGTVLTLLEKEKQLNTPQISFELQSLCHILVKKKVLKLPSNLPLCMSV